MRTFKARIGTSDETSADLEAILAVGNGQLVITVGDEHIGAWPVGEIHLDLTNRGYRMNIGDEALLVAPVNRFTFREAVDEERQNVAAAGKRTRWPRRRTASGQETPPSKRSAEAVTKADRADPSDENLVEPVEAKAAPRNWSSLSRRMTRSVTATPFDPPRPTRTDAPWEIPVGGYTVEPEPNLVVSWLKRVPLLWKIAVSGVVLAMGVGAVFPRLVATIMLIPGLLAVMTAGLGLIDPGYTRKLPTGLDEARLLTFGGILLSIGLLLYTFF